MVQARIVESSLVDANVSLVEVKPESRIAGVGRLLPEDVQESLMAQALFASFGGLFARVSMAPLPRPKVGE